MRVFFDGDREPKIMPLTVFSDEQLNEIAENYRLELYKRRADQQADDLPQAIKEKQ